MACRIQDLSVHDIHLIIDEYLGYCATMETVARRFETTPATISNILYKAVSQKIVDDITAQAIVSKTTGFTKNVARTKRRWEKALELRARPPRDDLEFYQTMLTSHQYALEELKEKIQQVQFQLETYDDFFFDEVDAPSKKTLSCTICRLKKQVEKNQKAVTEYEAYITQLKKA